MAAILTQNSVTSGASQGAESDLPSMGDHETPAGLAVELGIWLASIQAFSTGVHPHPMVHGHSEKGVSIVPEFRIIRSALLRSTRTAIKLLYSVRQLPNADDNWPSVHELERIAATLQDGCITADNLIGSDLSTGVWHAYRRMILAGLTAANADRFIKLAEDAGAQFLPSAFFELLERAGSNDEVSVLRNLLPRFARILKWLSIAGEMLENDEPLKPSVLIFSHVDRQLTELTDTIDQQLEKTSKAESEIFAALDAASYTASVELKKVRSKELPGLLHLDPATSVFARVETAYSLLNDSLQQIVTTFAKALDPDTSVFSLFPDFQVKRQNSIFLRSELWTLIRRVRAAEATPEADELDALYVELERFSATAAKHLFYKDTESVDRFIEEIYLTPEKVDIAPLLHRFGAFLETLLGQVNLRGVLQDHPFVPPQD